VSARDDVLARVRAAQSGAVVDVPREYVRSGTVSLDLLVERLEDYRAEVHRCADVEVPEVLRRLLTGTVVVPGGFPAQWLVPVVATLVTDEALSAADLDAVDAVVTTCAVAVCETGTVVLDAGPGQGRRALSLVPDRHVVVVRAAQVVATVPEALQRLDPARPQTWISGPSATSDIELQRVEGVHGPRNLVVVLVDV
jgi:L-lactate dehydrogenase complex protein LldG